MTETVNKAIRYFSSLSGKAVFILDFEKQFGGKAQKRKATHPDEILEFFSSYNLIYTDGDKIVPVHPFAAEAVLSVARSGIAFAKPLHGEEIFVSRQNRGNAHHRDRVFVKITGYDRGRFEGEVFEILQTFAPRYAARVFASVPAGSVAALFDLPDTPWVFVKTKRPVGTFLFLEPTGNTTRVLIPPSPETGKSPMQKSLSVYRETSLANPGDPAADFERIALKFSLPLQYPQELVPSKKELKEKEKLGTRDKFRKKMTRLYTCTIDGETAKDFDDAISLEKKKDRTILYVHIADVAWFVETDSPLEKEALRRGNSYYLNNQVLPMLPAILSEDFCSLRPKTKRLAVTAEVHYDLELNVIETHFYRSLIFINKRFTYNEAEKDLGRKNSPLRPFLELTDALGKKRAADGRIDLNLRDFSAVFRDDGSFSGLEEKPKLKSHKLIEECMLSANVAVAEFAVKNNIPMLHRNHEPMAYDHAERINAFLKLYGFKTQVKDTSPAEINKAIAVVAGSKEEHVFNYILLRSFMQANYHPLPKGHWGLGFEHYTHFTSPIRRFADLVVHRQLTAHLEGKPLPYPPGDLLLQGDQTSVQERIAMEAERNMLKLLSLRLLETSVGNTFQAFFTGFNSSGLFISLQEMSVEGFIPVSAFSKRGEVQALDDFRVLLPDLSKTIFLGETLEVVLEKADWEKIQLLFGFSGKKESPKNPQKKIPEKARSPRGARKRS